MTLARFAFLAAAIGGAMHPPAVAAAGLPAGAEKSFRDPRLGLDPQLEPVTPPPGLGAQMAFADPRAGRPTSFVLAEPLLPGSGAGNERRWRDLGGRPEDDAALQAAAWTAITGYLQRHAAVLRVDLSQLSAPRVGVFERGALIQAYSQRVLGGIPVRDSSLTAVVNHGNLVLLGLENWGDAGTPATPRIAMDEARARVARHAQPSRVLFAREPALEYVPMTSGSGYEYRLVWAVRATVPGDDGSWEGLVDAVTGELVAFEDRNAYAARKVMGGVYPVSNDQRIPDGIEQPGWPMPFVDVTTSTGTLTTTSGGTLGCVAGTISTALVGTYARITDTCGAINESSAAGDLDLGSGPPPPDPACAVPPGHSPGDTKAARTVFYAVNRSNEQARGWLPGNAWLGTSVPATTNRTGACAPSWNGTALFFSGGTPPCGNTGEIAGVVDHEWAHGLDDNGVNPNLSTPPEAVADIHASLRHNASCGTRGLFLSFVCTGYGDQCLGTPADGCTGPRDADFARHRCGIPHTFSWTRNGFTAAQCPAAPGGAPACQTGTGPCGRLMQCESKIPLEAVWDLHARDLRAAPFNLDAHTALELATRLTYLGTQVLTTWHTCAVGGGCGATGGYMLYLAADDDDGNLANGTPHMSAIRAAFERHEIHCATPAVVNSGCVNGPSAPPVLSVTPQDQGASLSWSASPNADRYYVYQAEGLSGDVGKIKIGETTGTTFVRTGLQNGRDYWFSVLPVGANTSCLGPMSALVAITPAGTPNVEVRPGHTLAVTGGDGDDFLDNCETGTVGFTVENTGSATLTNVRLVSVTFLTHPGSTLLTTLPALIAPTLTDCVTADGSFSFVLQGATPGQASQIEIGITADQLGSQVRTSVLSIAPVEQDVEAVASRTYGFETGLEGWTVVAGTWTRLAPGAQGSAFHVSSTENTPDTCDAIRSPAIRLKANSTLSIHNRYQIEPNDPTGGPYDRANVGVRDAVTGARTVIVPSGGQLYTVPGGDANGTCGQTGQPGWNGTSAGHPAFDESTWSAAAVNPGGAFTDRIAHIEIRYGTDALLHPAGLDFDSVTVTSFDAVVPDVLPDSCLVQGAAPVALAVDAAANGVLEPNELAALSPTWRNTGAAAITLSGATTGFTGPAGAAYANPDSAASYGTIGVGAQASCAATGNCYSVEATAATRPVTHWDSTIVETVTPSAATKTWTLHVGASFTDVPVSSPFYRFIETIVHKNVTGGCTATTYCPASSTTREQMAVFVLVSKEAPGYAPPACGATPMFLDVPASSPFCRWIEELARRGVVGGCGGGNYCPSASATREQMAVFVLRTLDPALVPPACGTPVFADVPASSPFCRWIEELARRAVVTGCGGGNYCPAANVTREQMSVFLAVTFGLALYGL